MALSLLVYSRNYCVVCYDWGTFMLRVVCLFLLLVVLSPLHVFADDMELDSNDLSSFVDKIEEQKSIPVEIMKKMGNRPYSVPLIINTDAQGNVISVELTPNQDLSDDTAYFELVQVAKNIVWNVGNIGVEKATTVSVSFVFSLQ